MPPKMTKIDSDLEEFLQYHNRLASFLDWNLDWELNGDKPSPEALARAGFFSCIKPPYDLDNVICPYCRLTLDSWEPNDDPKREHELRSPHCDFVHGRQKLRDMAKDAGGHPATNNPNGAVNKQNGTGNTNAPKQASQERAVGSSMANGLALAGANGDEAGPPPPRRTGRKRKQTVFK